MNMYDAVILAVTLILAIKGFLNGCIKEVFGLIGIIGGIYFAGMYYHQAGIYINNNLLTIPNKSAIDLVGFINVFLFFWVFCIFLGFLLGKIFKISALGFIDKLFGFLFGGLKFFLMISIIVASLYHIEFLKKEISKFTQKSVLFPFMLEIGEKIIHLSPQNFDVEKIKNNIEKKIKDAKIPEINLEDINKTFKNVKIPIK